MFAALPKAAAVMAMKWWVAEVTVLKLPNPEFPTAIISACKGLNKLPPKQCKTAEDKFSGALRKTYAPPTFVIYGRVGVLTRSGASGRAEGPGKSPVKKP